jgi:chromosome segregation ATPase
MKTILQRSKWMAFLLAGAALIPGQALAQSSQSVWPGYWESDSLGSAFDNLSNAERNALDARNKLAQAAFDYKRAILQLARTRKEVKEAYRSSPEIIEAQSELQYANAALTYALQPLMLDLAKLPVYEALVEKSEGLQKRLANDRDLVGTARDIVANELLEVKGQMRIHEQNAIALDVAADKAQKEVHAAQAKVRDLRAQLNDYMERDPMLVQATQNVSAARQSLLLAREDFATEVSRLGLSRHDYRRAAMTNAIIWDPKFWYGRYWWRY